MKEQIKKLFNVKTIVTLLLTIVFCILSLRGIVSGEQFLMVFTTIIAFYFGTQHEKKGTGKQREINKNKGENE